MIFFVALQKPQEVWWGLKIGEFARPHGSSHDPCVLPRFAAKTRLNSKPFKNETVRALTTGGLSQGNSASCPNRIDQKEYVGGHKTPLPPLD